MKWNINFYNYSVKHNTNSLPKSIRAKFEAIMDKMLEYGPDLGLPFTKTIGKGLFEIRAKGLEGIARGFFCTTVKNTVVILHVFVKKTQGTSKKELELAIKRMKEVKSYDI